MLTLLIQVLEHLVGMTVKTPFSTPRTAEDDGGELNGEGEPVVGAAARLGVPVDDDGASGASGDSWRERTRPRRAHMQHTHAARHQAAAAPPRQPPSSS
jgi:hypothetical protein